MRVIVTSGGTSEPIDQVRKITNHSTGALGKLITEKLLSAGHEVVLVTTINAVKPNKHKNLITMILETTAELAHCLAEEVPKSQAIVHAMAVSDYAPQAMIDLEDFIKLVRDNADLKTIANQSKKVSSKAEQQVILLNQNPKIIQQIKAWQPQILLIGFKLLVDVSDAELIEAAQKSIIKNHADYILANDLTQISPNQHIGFMVGKDQVERVETKQEISELILQKIGDIAYENDCSSSNR
ncbi:MULTISPECIES: phosphopantothenate--cysteine ligase [unclassified Enterococcus]|uniref:phosphopantothenate--cysteine ligase n=1 Tax=unclassified Enterococcus TaxID=2608891 RepID=UPI001555D4FB|nr:MULTISPECIES: phosphopantothenate--cysteine ligase [unclassified Enterococcus]MBS7578070.1 phosphopantothenate--cysteine ligase [Enterococcus sp. MMGLQ5-2]MBS7585330.1 phosphopantothenate--cysteine ligase [Enterococcus sp. MMGLQ5-1]NPD13187.1 phosphopantothenate--cysteine ligase [Enterococcus sp. MMGLQ5-1]NPD37901.1 phosphopantothenate--cysteine ligase [Enterococcus sp. MMGLQ5-2]